MFNNKSFRKVYQSILIKAFIITLLLNLFSVRAYAGEEFIEQARAVIKNYYIEQVSSEALNQPNIKDIVKSLNDPYSQYFTPQEYKEFTNNINLKITGIGVHIDTAPEGIKVVSVIDGSPAKGAGIKEGDIIITVGNNNLAGLSLEEAASYIKGEEGTTAHIRIKRDGIVYTYDVVRKQISFPTVEGKMLDNGAAYIKISSFGKDTSSDFRMKYEELNKLFPHSLIIDIRNNGGGYLDTAVDLLGSFIGEKPALITRDRFKGETTYLAPGNVSVIDKPVILLINEYSASASEILSAAIKDYNKAFIIGTRTYGKGTVQSLFELFDGSVIKLSIQKFYSPMGKEINKVGVQPDFEVDNVDSLAVAELLCSSSTMVDKRGYIKVNIGNREFEIDLAKARKPEYWPAFRYIINKVSLAGYGINMGTESGWVRLNVYSVEKLYNLLYPDYRETSELNGVSIDKQFTVTFTADVDTKTVNGENIKLIDAASGGHIPLGFEDMDGRRIKAIPKESLKPGSTYYFIISNQISGKDSGSLKEGTVTRVTVK